MKVLVFLTLVAVCCATEYSSEDKEGYETKSGGMKPYSHQYPQEGYETKSGGMKPYSYQYPQEGYETKSGGMKPYSYQYPQEGYGGMKPYYYQYPRPSGYTYMAHQPVVYFSEPYYSGSSYPYPYAMPHHGYPHYYAPAHYGGGYPGSGYTGYKKYPEKGYKKTESATEYEE